MIQKIATSTAAVLTVIVCGLALWAMHEAVLLLVIALAISAGLAPLISYLIGRGFKRVWAIVLTYAGVLVPLLVLLVLLSVQAISDIVLLIDRAPPQYDQMRQMLLNESSFGQYIGRLLPDSQSLIRSLTRANPETLGMTVISTISQALVIGILLLSIASLGFYWLADQQRIERLLLSLLPTQQRSIARSLWNNLYRDVGQTVSGEVVLVVCGILSLYIGYWALGINGASVLAMIGGLMLLVPVLTIPLALVPAALIAGLQSPLLSLLAVIVGTLTLLAIKRFVAPRVFSAKASINPVLVIVLIMVLAEFAGFWAFLAALPLAAALQAIGNTIRAEQQHSLPEPQRVEVQAIQERIELLAQQIADDQPEAVRMKGLVSRAQKVATELAQLIDPPSGTGSGGRPDRSADLAGRIDAPQPHISRSTRGK